MKMLFLTSVSIILVSCNISDKILKETQSIISLRRTACFGSCPIYQIEIFSNGNGIYTGTRFVKNIGATKFQLSKNELDVILSYANQIGFTNMQGEYYEPLSDLPTTYIKIYAKEIKDYIGAPKELKILEELIDQMYLQAITD